MSVETNGKHTTIILALIIILCLTAALTLCLTAAAYANTLTVNPGNVKTIPAVEENGVKSGVTYENGIIKNETGKVIGQIVKDNSKYSNTLVRFLNKGTIINSCETEPLTFGLFTEKNSAGNFLP